MTAVAAVVAVEAALGPAPAGLNYVKAILDSGCPKIVGGQFWFDMYRQSLKQIEDFKNLYIE